MSSIAAFIDQLPKAELHLHLEGAVSPALFARLRAKYGVPTLEADDRAAGQFPDLAAFLAVYGKIFAKPRTRRSGARRPAGRAMWSFSSALPHTNRSSITGRWSMASSPACTRRKKTWASSRV
jgi:hypothetical protein